MDEEGEVDGATVAVPAGGSSRLMSFGGWTVAMVAVIAAALLLWSQSGRETQRLLRSSIPPPSETSFHIPGIAPGPAALSPDGTKMVFSARDQDGLVQLYLRSLDAPQAHVLSGTDGAQYPFWSPDSKWVAFFTQQDETLKKVDAAGGPPITICSAEDGKGGSWGAEGVIVFTPSSGTPLHRVSASGGVSEQITEIDRTRHNSHRHPRFLPDGRRFLYMARATSTQDNTIMIGSLDGDLDKEIVRTVAQAEYANGHLFFMRDQSLMAQAFDVDSLEFTGDAQPVAEATLTIVGAALGIFSVSPAGLLAYHTGEVNETVKPMWYDRSGRELSPLGDPGEYVTLALSPDGRSAALSVVVHASGTFDLWTYDLVRDLKTRFTFDEGMDIWPVWSPDGQTLAFASDREGTYDIYRMGIGGVRGAEPLLEAETNIYPIDWSGDGEWIVYMQEAEETGLDIWALPLIENGEPVPVRTQPSMDAAGGVSPDGRWLTYFSDESGEFEVYVTPFPEAGRRWQASTNSGFYPFWCADGREIVYQQIDGQLMSVDIELGDNAVTLGETRPLFGISTPENLGPAFAPTADCERFLVIPPGENSDTTLLNLVVGWPQLLEEE
jgi:Tol biopolymer transport system component